MTVAMVMATAMAILMMSRRMSVHSFQNYSNVKNPGLNQISPNTAVFAAAEHGFRR
jgi:hypothetical protein